MLNIEIVMSIDWFTEIYWTEQSVLAQLLSIMKKLLPVSSGDRCESVEGWL